MIPRAGARTLVTPTLFYREARILAAMSACRLLLRSSCENLLAGLHRKRDAGKGGIGSFAEWKEAIATQVEVVYFVNFRVQIHHAAARMCAHTGGPMNVQRQARSHKLRLGTRQEAAEGRGGFEHIRHHKMLHLAHFSEIEQFLVAILRFCQFGPILFEILKLVNV